MNIAYVKDNNSSAELSYCISKEETFTRIYYEYADDIYRLCYSFMKNESDAEDVTQETFMKYYTSDKEFDNEKHIKAWLIVTASNHCKNLLKHWWRKRKDLEGYFVNACTYNSEPDEMMELVMKLPEKYKTAVFLYYYEGYDTNEIAKLLGKPAPTVRSYLQKARKLLKNELDNC